MANTTVWHYKGHAFLMAKDMPMPEKPDDEPGTVAYWDWSETVENEILSQYEMQIYGGSPASAPHIPGVDIFLYRNKRTGLVAAYSSVWIETGAFTDRPDGRRMIRRAEIITDIEELNRYAQRASEVSGYAKCWRDFEFDSWDRCNHIPPKAILDLIDVAE